MRFSILRRRSMINIPVFCTISFVSMDMAQNILVIKTVSGMAMAVAAALDAIHFSEIVAASPGTIRSCVQSVRWTIRSC